MEGWAFILMLLICVGLPITLGIGSGVFKHWAKLKEKQLELAAHEAADKAASQAVHIEKLEARMRVLERIATDKSGSLSAEIEDLRGDVDRERLQ
ncbi:MAG: hypothetical protein WA979_00375 [Pacificimonas sp.]